MGRLAAAVAPAAVALLAALATPSVRAGDADDLPRRAGEALRAGRLAEGRGLLEQAAEERPDAPAIRLMLAAALLRGGDLRGARREVDRALELAPGDPGARELSGDIHYREGELNLAAAEWEAAAKGAASHALAAKLGKARREMDAEQGLERESSRNFALLYDEHVPRALIDGFLPLLDGTFETLHDRFGDSPRDPVTVILYSSAAFRDVTRAPEWVGGLYDGKIRVPVGGLATVEEAAGLAGILVHEMTHAFLHRMAPEGLPRWFQEGLATGFQGLTPEGARAFLGRHGAAAPANLDDLDRALLGRGGDVNAAYAGATLAVAEIVDARGFGAVRRIIDAVGAGATFEAALREDARMDLAELGERWRRGLP